MKSLAQAASIVMIILSPEYATIEREEELARASMR
ncbi:hypothetical protein FHX72_002184 [Pseudoclavibacter helvolus]|uniref:Uncharacterized protein n=1 Tax=Pseudoclavibacter helvolus TaxID=255205 RepID=A0A7W4YEY1_9MICO|nr:hypothetical protein [Pseudoclavibacter helvolus]